jgi:hypothetical protein
MPINSEIIIYSQVVSEFTRMILFLNPGAKQTYLFCEARRFCTTAASDLIWGCFCTLSCGSSILPKDGRNQAHLIAVRKKWQTGCNFIKTFGCLMPQ